MTPANRHAIEAAADVVVDWLASHGHHDLAQAVSLAVDTRTPRERRAHEDDARRVAAQVLGSLGGRAGTEAQAQARRENGAKGGRPKKTRKPR